MTTKLAPVKVTNVDKIFLLPFLRNWNILSATLSKDILSLTQLRKMLVIESEGKKRVHILERLMSKVNTKLREHQKKEFGISHQKESSVEGAVCKYAQNKGFETPKFSSPGTRSVPDRMFIGQGIIFFIEFKRPGEIPTAAQKRKAAKWKKWGHSVYSIDNIEDGKSLIRREIERRIQNGK